MAFSKKHAPDTGTNVWAKPSGKAPARRMRRLRRHDGLRDMLQEHRLDISDLVQPLFVEETLETRMPITALPGVYRETEESLEDAVRSAEQAGIKAVMLFGISHNKDAQGTDTFKQDGLLYRMINRAKEAAPDIAIIADACFCEYTDHGHCGVLDANGDVDNDRTLDNLRLQAITAARAGADMIAPSGMMDGMVGAIRDALDQDGHQNLPILSYAAKFASSYYGPFRDASGCSLGSAEHAREDRKTYQMNPANALEALQEVEIDLEEGADMIMVKPGLPYLDIIHRVKEEFRVPTFAYHVSGEYAMLKAASDAGALDYDAALMETMISFKRAGADGILTYAATDLARILTA